MKQSRTENMLKDLSSEESVVVATFTNWNDAEIARAYLEDRGIPSLVGADEVHTPVQLTDGVRLRVLSSRASEALEELETADLLHNQVEPADPELARSAMKQITILAFAVIIALILISLLVNAV